MEREAELGRIEELIVAAGAGTGSIVSIEGAAGIGKTAFLRAARERARGAGLKVLSARCGELERDMVFGVARQLLEPVVVRASDDDQAMLLAGAAELARGALGLADVRTPAGDPFAALHGLYWVCSNLCDRGPLVFAVDDAHWADLQSLRWLAYLARRVEDLPILVLLANRPDEAGAAQETVRAMVAERTAEALPLAPLGVAAVSRVVRDRFEHADQLFCMACHEASGGNPLLLRELLVAMFNRGVAGTADEASSVESLTTSSVLRYVQLRLERLGDTAVSVARAAAILGEGNAQLGQCARLAEAEFEDAARAADDLRAADILHGGGALEFVHPLVRAAVYADIAPSARSASHAAAARIVAADAGGPDRVGAHLLATQPCADAWVVQQLRAAAASALEAGAPDAAAALLTRALAEPPPADTRIAVLIECSTATYPVDPTSAAEHLAEALGLADEPTQRAQIALRLAKALGYSDRPGEAVAMIESLRGKLDGIDEELARLVECELLQWGHFWLDNPDRPLHHRRLATMTRDLPGESASQRTALGLRAWHLVLGDAPAREALTAAGRALRPGRLFTHPELGFDVPALAAATFLYCDELDRAFELFDRGVEELRSAGWLVHLVFAYTYRAHVRLRQGALLEAEADAATAWELSRQLEPNLCRWWTAFGILIPVLIARGSIDRAQELIESNGVHDVSPDVVMFPLPRVVRGQLHAALGNHEQAVEELMAAGALMDRRGFRNPSCSPWRIYVTPSLAALGRPDEARSVIGEAVMLARRVGAPLALGAALRSAGQLETGETALGLLAESVQVLERSPGRMEHAASLVAYGSALRRAKRWGDARVPLRAGLELAERCGARDLSSRAREEIAASGGRVRTGPESGVAALTASELRVARRASAGRKNREIATDLFVTLKTVEKHLASTYRKLSCSRAELAAELAEA